MKICFVSYYGLPVVADGVDRRFGGAEYQQGLLGRALHERGHEVTFVLVNLPDDIRSDFRLLEAYDESAGVPFFRFFHPRLTGLWNALKRADADIYYQRSAGLQTGVVGRFCRSRAIPFVFGVANDSDCRIDSQLLPRWIDRMFYSHGLKCADIVLTQHERQNELLERNVRIEGTIVRNIAEPCRVEIPKNRDGGVIWIGNLSSRKQPSLYLEMARKLSDIRFQMVGGWVDSEPDVFERIKEEARHIPNLSFHGSLSLREVEVLLSRAQLLVNTSKHEGLPNTFLQAWSYSLPVVTLVDWPGVIVSRRLGIVCEGSAELEQAIAQLMANPSVRNTLAKNGLDYVQTVHSPAAIGDQYEEIFRNAIASRQKAPGYSTEKNRS